jgi:hypothetical protein
MQKTLLFLCFFLTISIISKSQTRALTETGKEVLLFDNGTWKYSDSGAGNSSDTIAINNKQFSKTPNARYLLKSNIFNVGFYINQNKWTYSPRKENEKNPEYRFSLKNNDGYAMMVTEKTPVSLDNMPQIALENAQDAAPDAKLTLLEYRNVNGKKVLCLQIKGTTQGIKFEHFGYYYSNENGTVQLVCYSSEQQFENLKNEFEDFLNGLTEI